jgi:putative ABC transport system substrate-binding protein
VTTRRRDVLAGLASAALPWRTHAQPAQRPHHVGVLDTSPKEQNANFRAFAQALREHGYVEGENLVLSYRAATGRNDDFAALASELARLNVEVIVTRGTPAALAARAATATIPVVMAAAGDPVAIARDKAMPAPNMTGFGASIRGAERKRVETLQEMLPNITRMAALMNMSNPSRRAEWSEIEAGARELRLAAEVLDARSVADIERSFEAARNARLDALLVGSDTLMQTNQALVVGLAAAHRLPAIYTFRDYVDAGGLVSLGVSLPALFRRAAGYVDRILNGATPVSLPIEPPTRFELIVNAGAAKAIGLTLPQAFLVRADEVIG